MTYIYRLRWYYANRHSGFLYEPGEVFVSNFPAEKAAENHFRCKVWRLATPTKKAVGSGLWLLLYWLHREGYLEQIESIPTHLIPHLRTGASTHPAAYSKFGGDAGLSASKRGHQANDGSI